MPNTGNIAYDDNSFYLDDNGVLSYYNSSISTSLVKIALASEIKTIADALDNSNEELNKNIASLNTSITDIYDNKIGSASVIGGKNATGLYVYIEDLEKNKVDNSSLDNYYTKTDIGNNYYTKEEANGVFLSADEELFLTDGIFVESYEYASKDGKYVQWSTELNLPESDKKTGPCIILTIKNSTATPTENTIIIPAGELVDVYTAKDTNTIDMSVNGLEISADVKTANLIKSQLTDDVVLTVGTDNKITTSFNTANIIN